MFDINPNYSYLRGFRYNVCLLTDFLLIVSGKNVYNLILIVENWEHHGK